MPYNNLISRGDVAAAVPEEVSNELLTSLEAESAALSLFRRVNMATNQTRMPVLAALPMAYWVTGDTGLKQTTEVSWANKYLIVEELAAIVPIPEAVLEDMNFNVWDSVWPLLSDAIVRAFDAAIFLGTNKPVSWPDDIVTAAIAANNDVTMPAAVADVPDELSNLFAKVEEDGFNVDFVIANPNWRGLLRRAGLAQTLTPAPGVVVGPGEIYGIVPTFPMPGLWPTGSGEVEAIAGSRREGIVGLRKDMTWKILTEATIHDADGNPMFNLAQQDMVALRIVFRAAFQVANTIRYDNTDAGTRYPFAVALTA